MIKKNISHQDHLEKTKLSIIIVNYNVAEEVRECIKSIKSSLSEIKYEIIVVDNNSKEQLIYDLPELFKDVKFIYLDSNTGYGLANNTGVDNSSGKFILILNPDTLFVDNNIISMIEFMESNPRIGAVTPMLVYKDDSFQYSFGLDRGVVVEYLDSIYVFNNLYEKYKKRELDKLISKGRPFEVGWISGAYMLMRKCDFQRVGGFSAEYKLNYEDMDLCFKLRKKGLKLYYFPEFKCVHIESVSQKKNFYNYIFYRYKGRLIFLKNHYSPFHNYMIRLLHIFGLVLRIILSYFIFNKNEGKERRLAFRDSMILYLKFFN